MADIQHTQTHPKFTLSDKTRSQKPRDLIQSVKKSAMYHWENLLPACGIDIPAKDKHGACPICGGTDRFHFIDDHHHGNWHCRQCDMPNYGDGLDLVARTKGISITEAAKIVANVLALPLPELKPARKTIQTTQPIADRVAALMAQTVAGQSPYLTSKGLHCPNQRLLPDNSAVLRLTTLDKKVTGAQIIKPDGEKKLLTGSQKKGAFIPLSTLEENPNTVIITEGYATALTVNQFCKGAVLAALDAGNLLSVAQSVRERWPGTKIIIAADNDGHHPDELDKNGKPKVNTGKISAEKAAIAVNGWITLPPTEHKADWDDYRQQYGVETAKLAFAQGLYQPAPITKKAVIQPKDAELSKLTLCQMGASQRGEVLLARYDGDLALDSASETVHHYDGIVWCSVSDRDLQREMVAAFMEEKMPYSPHGIGSAVDALKLQLPMMNSPERHLIGFRNGVFDLKIGQFRPHYKHDWLLLANDVEFNSPVSGETLQNHATQFWHWLNRATAHCENKAERVLAALFMVLANRCDWQLFLEVTGAGGSGKSIFAEVCSMLAGKGNTVSASMAALENPRERALIVGYSLIILPDQTRYVGDGSGIKAITGGDEVAIDPKHKQPYSTRIPAVVLAVNNNAMSFSDRSGGVSRRRVIFNFSEVVPENERDPLLRDKIAAELPIIIRQLLHRFADPQTARRLLAEQQKSEEALDIKRGTDPLVDFCGYLVASHEADGLLIGNAEIVPFNPRKYLYHAYLAYMKGNNLNKPVSVTRFGMDMPGALAEYNQHYLRKKSKQGIRSNLDLNIDTAIEWLPKLTENNLPEE
ncbi:toprim domain-containing protein [Xenorhabdus cabanillasii]|uniref:P4-specific DNA primase n=1 Tax=Xenorhabdus cabanillasii JM26 TaxID=1427517 RepID=W1JBP2_9GAMM|nr:toprim domain-containing protein [Xenorhabdus cabanillasii]PHM78321.1 DNA primase [Xenorhabdus cabanillasii JM26]CDL86930.1 putative P4-specific DNA primase [Xenorhabdus cabanillasii JM26]